MMRLLVGYAATLVVFCVVDFAWLGWIAKGFYQSQIGGLLLAQPNWVAAIAFYALYAVALMFFCVAPALDDGALTRVAVNGALFGLFAYMTYDLSNLATLKGWSVSLALVDMVWGAFVSAIASSVGYIAARAVAHGA
jgi:uncharacterized membrane protein